MPRQYGLVIAEYVPHAGKNRIDLIGGRPNDF